MNIKRNAIVLILSIAVFALIYGHLAGGGKPAAAANLTAYNIYAVKYLPCDRDKADKIAALCGFGSLTGEDGEKYVYAANGNEADIYKDTNEIVYAASDESKEAGPADDTSLIARSISAIEDCHLPVNYEEAVVEQDNGGYSVKFIARLGDLKNEAFENEVYFDENGRFTGFRYYYNEYEKIDSLPVISEKDARIEGGAGITGCELVYRLDENVVQPAYKFTGADFEAYVDASKY